MAREVNPNVYKEYKIVIDKKAKNCIRADHSKKELLVSNDINLTHTDDGSLLAEFSNFRQSKNRKILGIDLSKKQPQYDCSVVISNPSKFDSCVQQKGVYQLSGSNLVFNGTKEDDNLVLNGTSNSQIKMNDGNDTVLYREKATYNNDIDLGNGNNVFASNQLTDADKPLIKNRITAGKGNDYIHLRDAVDNTVSTGDGKDLVEIQGGSSPRYARTFSGNNIDTGGNNDTVSIQGEFGQSFSGNKFYLGKGSDTFRASINPQDDTQSVSEYQSRELKYTSSVQGNEIYADGGGKNFFGFGEKNTFEAQTYTANKLNENANFSACSKGFQDFINKPVPQSSGITVPQSKVIPTATKLTREDYSRMYSAGSMGYMLFRDPKMLESAFKALDDYVKSME